MESTQVIKLVEEAISDLDYGQQILSIVIRKCIRIARLRSDFYNLLWLEKESIDTTNGYGRTRILGEIRPHFTKEQFSELKKIFVEMWIKEWPALKLDNNLQPVKTDLIIGKPVGELEIDLEGLLNTYKSAVTPPGMHPIDTAYYDNQNFYLRMSTQHQIDHYRSILERIKNRIYDFLSQTEKQIIYGQIHSDIFEQNRQYIENRLGQLCPEALSKFVVAYHRSKENDPESWAQALTSCRRLLKDLADALYPPSKEPVIGADGKPRILTDDQFKNRLRQYIYEHTGRSTSRDLLLASVQDLGNRIDQLYELTNKGVHAEVSEFEVNKCLIQT